MGPPQARESDSAGRMQMEKVRLVEQALQKQRVCQVSLQPPNAGRDPIPCESHVLRDMEPGVVCFEDETLRRTELRKPVAQFHGPLGRVTGAQDLCHRRSGAPGLYPAPPQ